MTEWLLSLESDQKNAGVAAFRVYLMTLKAMILTLICSFRGDCAAPTSSATATAANHQHCHAGHQAKGGPSLRYEVAV